MLSEVELTRERRGFPGKDISLNDLAQLAGLSRFHFLRAFKKTTEETPYQYLLRRRIARAQTLLRHGNMSITEITSAVGFKDSTRFIKAFRRIVGVTPGTYQKLDLSPGLAF